MRVYPNRARREAFARSVAYGARPEDAWLDAGYKARKDAPSRSRKLTQSMAERIGEIRYERHQAAQDISPLVEELIAMARRVVGREGEVSPAAWNAARGLLAEAGKLKIRMPDPELPPRPPERELTEEEWMATFVNPPNRP